MPDRRYQRAIELFNEREFFACHDVLEDIWAETLGTERNFYQGLIHAAVSLFHFEGGNLGGARKMYNSTVRYLTPYRPRFQGIDLDQFLDTYETCFSELLAPHATYPGGVTLNQDLIPSIELRDTDS